MNDPIVDFQLTTVALTMIDRHAWHVSKIVNGERFTLTRELITRASTRDQGGAIVIANEAHSAQPCGCDKGARWKCAEWPECPEGRSCRTPDSI